MELDNKKQIECDFTLPKSITFTRILKKYFGKYSIDQFESEFNPEKTEIYRKSIQGLDQVHFFKVEIIDDMEEGQWHHDIIGIPDSEYTEMAEMEKFNGSVTDFINSIDSDKKLLQFLDLVLTSVVLDPKYNSIDREVRTIITEYCNCIKYSRDWRGDHIDSESIMHALGY